jgi:23S rRNA (adenine2503-C2)-methyltransferase
MIKKGDIKDRSLEDLQGALPCMGGEAYRAKQIFSWLYKKGVVSFSEMANLPDPLIKRLEDSYGINKLYMSKRLVSRDKTEKFLFKLSDGKHIETVLIYAKDRETLCVSSQVGCKFACSFCASGRMGFQRDLMPSEIIGQAEYATRDLGRNITNYVFMGMGEPLDNYENVAKAIGIMTGKEGLGISARRVTLSTCGIVPGIERLAASDMSINLSISLHAADNKLRDRLVPVNKRYPLEELIKSCESYLKKKGRTITLEYVMIKGMNISAGDADRLAKIALKLRAKVNLIKYSGISGSDHEAPGGEEAVLFVERLKKKKINVTLRRSRGQDIQAACGQLAGSG